MGKPDSNKTSKKHQNGNKEESPKETKDAEEVVEEVESEIEEDSGSDSVVEDIIGDEDVDDADDPAESDEKDDVKKPAVSSRSSTSNRRKKGKEEEAADSDSDYDDHQTAKHKISNFIQKVFVAHKSIEKIGWDQVETMQLIHPRTKSPALFLLHARNQSNSELELEQNGATAEHFFIYEVLTMKQDTRSWFIGDNIISDGNIYTFTPMDPLFLIMFSMSKSSQARPLLDHLEEVFCRKAAKLLCGRISTKQLENISTRKVVGDVEAYLYSESKAFSWLAEKVNKVADFLRKKNITSSESSISINFTKLALDSESTEYLRYAADIVCEYVNEEIQAKLFAKLNLPLIRPKRKTADEDESSSKKLKTVDNVTPLEDYGSAVKAIPLQKTAKGKARVELEKAAKGTHLLSKFFQVKPKTT